MKKKLLTLAVAAAVAAPTLASAEAIMYGKLNMSIDYQTVDNVYPSIYNATIFGQPGDAFYYAGDDIYVNQLGQAQYRVPTGTVMDPELIRGLIKVAPGATGPSQDFQGWSLNRGPNMRGSSRANRLGVKGSEDLGNGLKAIYQIEFEISMANETDEDLANGDLTVDLNGNGVASGPIKMRNSFVGLAGDWGTFLVGRHDTPLKISTAKLDLFSDTMADYNGTIGFTDIRADNAIAYVSPSWSGFQLAAALVPGGGGTATNASNIDSDSINQAWSIAAIYSNGPFYASVAYETLGSEMFMDTATAYSTCYPNVGGLPNGAWTSYSCSQVDDDFTQWRIGLGILDWNGFTLTGVYANEELPTAQDWLAISDPDFSWQAYNLPSGPDSRELWQLQAGYTFGNFMLKAMYGESTYDGNYVLPQYTYGGVNPTNAAVYQAAAKDYYEGGSTSWAIGVDYNFSQRTKAYALYTATTIDGSDTPNIVGNMYNIVDANHGTDWDGFSLGLMHSF